MRDELSRHISVSILGKYIHTTHAVCLCREAADRNPRELEDMGSLSPQRADRIQE